MHAEEGEEILHGIAVHDAIGITVKLEKDALEDDEPLCVLRTQAPRDARVTRLIIVVFVSKATEPAPRDRMRCGILLARLLGTTEGEHFLPDSACTRGILGPPPRRAFSAARHRRG
eukprot:194621-Prymnesium_polylepis.1